MTLLVLQAVAAAACFGLSRFAEYRCWFYVADVCSVLWLGVASVVGTALALVHFEHLSLETASRTPAWLYALMVALSLIFGAISYRTSEWIEDDEPEGAA